MVFYFRSNVVNPPVVLFMGKDKFENEDLIKWGWPEDVWFHVHNYSSAHVYLRLGKGQSLEDVPNEVIVDAAQLVKNNSIQGNKLDNISVVYTMWENLKKTNDMEVGQVAFHDDAKVRYYQVEKRRNDIVNRLNKTKSERFPDLREEREKRDQAQRELEKAERRRQNELEKERQKQRQKEEELKSYRSLLKSENMTSNYDNGNDSDEFM